MFYDDYIPGSGEMQEINPVKAWKIYADHPVCPCCGKKLKFIHKNVKTDEFIGESLNERWENDYLTDRVQDIANQLYQEELEDVQPEIDRNGNITQEYLERFEYNSPSLKKAVKRAATKLSNDLAEDGFKINAWYCEQEIFEALKYYAKGFGRK
jgi:rubredoxin